MDTDLLRQARVNIVYGCSCVCEGEDDRMEEGRSRVVKRDII